MATPLQPPPRKWRRTQKNEKKKKHLPSLPRPCWNPPPPPILPHPCWPHPRRSPPLAGSPPRFFSSPWEFRLSGRTICPSLRLENSVCQAERSVRPGSTGPLKCETVRLSGPISPRQLKRGTIVERTDRQTHCCNYIRDGSWYQLIQSCHLHGQVEPSLTLVPSSSWGSLVQTIVIAQERLNLELGV